MSYQIEVIHEFVANRSSKAKCRCGWWGKPTVDKRKSFNGHARRVA